MWDRPTLHAPVWLSILCGICISILVVIYRDAGKPNAMEVALSLVLVVLAIVFGLYAAATGINWAIYTWTEREKERRETASITPRSTLMRLAAQLTPEQAKLIPFEEYRAHVGVMAGEEPAYFLITQGGMVPMQWVQDFLDDSNTVKLRPVRTYSEGTVGRENAQLVTAWLVGMGLAIPDSGSNPARWMNDHSKLRAYSLLGLEWQSNGLE